MKTKEDDYTIDRDGTSHGDVTNGYTDPVFGYNSLLG